MVGVVALLVHTNRAVDTVVEQHNNGFGTVLHSSRQLLSIHQKVAIARNGEYSTARQNTGGNTGGYAVAHRPRSRRKLNFVSMRQTTVLVESMYPARKISCAIGQDCIVG